MPVKSGQQLSSKSNSASTSTSTSTSVHNSARTSANNSNRASTNNSKRTSVIGNMNGMGEDTEEKEYADNYDNDNERNGEVETAFEGENETEELNLEMELQQVSPLASPSSSTLSPSIASSFSSSSSPPVSSRLASPRSKREIKRRSSKIGAPQAKTSAEAESNNGTTLSVIQNRLIRTLYESKAHLTIQEAFLAIQRQHIVDLNNKLKFKAIQLQTKEPSNTNDQLQQQLEIQKAELDVLKIENGKYKELQTSFEISLEQCEFRLEETTIKCAEQEKIIKQLKQQMDEISARIEKERVEISQLIKEKNDICTRQEQAIGRLAYENKRLIQENEKLNADLRTPALKINERITQSTHKLIEIQSQNVAPSIDLSDKFDNSIDGTAIQSQVEEQYTVEEKVEESGQVELQDEFQKNVEERETAPAIIIPSRQLNKIIDTANPNALKSTTTTALGMSQDWKNYMHMNTWEFDADSSHSPGSRDGRSLQTRLNPSRRSRQRPSRNAVGTGLDDAFPSKLDILTQVNLQFPSDLSHSPSLITGTSIAALQLLSAAELALENTSTTTVATSSSDGLVQYNSNGKDLTLITVGQLHNFHQSQDLQPQSQQGSTLPAIHQRHDRHGQSGKLTVLTPVLQLPSPMLTPETKHLHMQTQAKPLIPSNEEKDNYREDKQNPAGRYNKYLSYSSGRIQR